MNRYDMLSDRRKNKPVAYIFKPSRSPDQVYKYLKICMENDVSLDANNLYQSTVDQALAKLQKDIKIPIITKSEKMMLVLSLSNLKKVYTIKDIPEDVIRVVCYWDLNPKEIPRRIDVALAIHQDNIK